MKRIAGDAYLDFCFVDDGYDEDRYSFLKCRTDMNVMERLRASHQIISVLDSYDNPVYLQDHEVRQFINDGKDKERKRFAYGDSVTVGGEGVFSGLQGVVIALQSRHSLVAFRFHTLSVEEWIANEELTKTGNVFSYLKFPVTNKSFLKRQTKYPITEEKDVGPGQPDRQSNREGDEDEM